MKQRIGFLLTAAIISVITVGTGLLGVYFTKVIIIEVFHEVRLDPRILLYILNKT